MLNICITVVLELTTANLASSFALLPVCFALHSVNASIVKNVCCDSAEYDERDCRKGNGSNDSLIVFNPYERHCCPQDRKEDATSNVWAEAQERCVKYCKTMFNEVCFGDYRLM